MKEITKYNKKKQSKFNPMNPKNTILNIVKIVKLNVTLGDKLTLFLLPLSFLLPFVGLCGCLQAQCLPSLD